MADQIAHSAADWPVLEEEPTPSELLASVLARLRELDTRMTTMAQENAECRQNNAENRQSLQRIETQLNDNSDDSGDGNGDDNDSDTSIQNADRSFAVFNPMLHALPVDNQTWIATRSKSFTIPLSYLTQHARPFFHAFLSFLSSISVFRSVPAARIHREHVKNHAPPPPVTHIDRPPEPPPSLI